MAGRRSEQRVLIVGGGIQGCSAAFFLARRRWRVTLLERDRIGRHASGVNAGGVRCLGRDPEEIPLSLAARDIWQGLDGFIGDASAAYHPAAHVKPAIDEAGRRLGLDRIEQLHRGGFEHEIWLQAHEVRNRLPGLKQSVLGGILVEGDGWALPWRIVRGFAEAARRCGAEIREGCRVTALARRAGAWRVESSAGILEADQVINCAGAWGAEMARQAGDHDLPLSAHAPMLAVTESRPAILRAVVGVLGHTLSLKQLDTGHFVIGGGVRAHADTGSCKAELDVPRLSRSMRLACRLFPDIANARVIRCWSGIEGYTPDNLPVIGPGRLPGMLHGFGFSAHGFQLGPAVGEALADLVLARQPRVDLAPFRPGRFSSGPTD